MFNTEDFKKSVLDRAMRGKLTKQLPEDGDAKDLLNQIDAEKKALIKEGKIKAQKTLAEITEDEMPFEIPENWQWVRLGKIGYITSGGTPKRNIDEYWNSNDIPWLTPKFLGQNQDKVVLNNSEQYISKAGLNKSSAQLISKGSIVYSSRAPIGHINIVNFDYTTNQGAKSVTTLYVNTQFIYYALKQQTKNISKRGSGTTFKEISGTKFGESLIPLPPLPEQQRIVKNIDKCFDLANHIDQEDSLTEKFNVDMRKSLLQSAMMGKLTKQLPEDGNASELLVQIKAEKEALVKAKKIKAQKPLPEIDTDEIPFEIPDNWRWVRLGDITTKITDGTHNPPKNSYEGVPIISAKNIKDKGIDFSLSDRYVTSEQFLKEDKRTQIRNGDILLTIVGTIGKVCVVNEDKDFTAQRSICVINTLIFNKFLSLYLKSPAAFSYYNIKSKGTAQRGIYLNSVRNLIIPIPPLSEQKRIVNKLDKLFEELKG